MQRNLFPNLCLTLAVTLLLLLTLSAPAQAARQVSFGPLTLPVEGNIALPVATTAQGEIASSELLTQLDGRSNGAIMQAMNEAGFTGAEGETLSLYGVAPYSRIDLIGVGEASLEQEIAQVTAEDFGGRAASLNDGTNGSELQLLWPGADAQSGARVALGFRLGDYRFDRYQQTRRDPETLGSVRILSPSDNAAAVYENDLAFLGDSVALGRDLSSEPGNVIFPESFVERVKEAFKGVDGVRIKVLDVGDMERLGMGALLGVGGGSARPPRLLIMEYMAGGDEPPLVLAGKGITFDTGGISLKNPDNMWHMKADMTGAAVVSATVLAAARRGAEVNLVALAALAENMPSGSANRPGDVLKSMSGRTIEIKSTDAEGRLVLSDAVYYAQQQYQPDVLIDVATLTGSVGRALGEYYAGLFGNNEELMGQLMVAGEQSGEELWRLPLDQRYYDQNASTIADVRNGGSGNAGASTGAAFIGFFIAEDQPWAHLDIAGMDHIDDPRPTMPAGYSAWGIRLLDQYIRDQREP